MKKKILALCLVVVLAVTAVTGVTLAYFTDTDADVNVMYTGNVKIIQNETKKDGSAYEDVDLFPLVVTDGYTKVTKDNKVTDTDGSSMIDVWDASINNEIDKFVSVTNHGTEKAYVRTILAFETVRSYEEGSSTEWTDLHDHFFLINGDYDYLTGKDNKIDEMEGYDHPIYGKNYPNFKYITVDGVEYALAVKVYETALEPGATTPSSLRQFALTNEAGNEIYDFFGESYEIIALSQAVQTEGFEAVKDEAGNVIKSAAAVALDTAFGELDGENGVSDETLIEWLTNVDVKTKGESNFIGGEAAEAK